MLTQLMENDDAAAKSSIVTLFPSHLGPIHPGIAIGNQYNTKTQKSLTFYPYVVKDHAGAIARHANVIRESSIRSSKQIILR
mgnify:CR=1 FL=1